MSSGNEGHPTQREFEAIQNMPEEKGSTAPGTYKRQVKGSAVAAANAV